MPAVSTTLDPNAKPYSVGGNPVAPPPGFCVNNVHNDEVPNDVKRVPDPDLMQQIPVPSKYYFKSNVSDAFGRYDSRAKDPKPNPQFHEPLEQTSNSRPNDMNWLTYLDRQGRNEYITLASQISYDGTNMAFVFYENQIRRLMNEKPYAERRLEVLRASCVGQPREMVNLFCAPLKGMTISQRIEKALHHLRQRYGVPGGLVSEPKVKAVRYGPKVAFTSASLGMFGEDLNTLEVFAYAHNEVQKLSGQLLFDTASRLPNLLKRRYLDYLDKRNLNMSEPGFELLREFVVHEIKMMTSECAQAFLNRAKRTVLARLQPALRIIGFGRWLLGWRMILEVRTLVEFIHLFLGPSVDLVVLVKEHEAELIVQSYHRYVLCAVIEVSTI